jgi:anaerobic selenocysteine-containing dehydrogenase
MAAAPRVPIAPVPHSATDVASACVICNHNCGVRMDVVDGRITQVRKDPGNPFSQGHLCNKAVSIPLLEENPRRLRQPLRRGENGRLEPVSWDDAIAEIAARLNRILDRHGGRALAASGMGGQGTHMGGQRLLGLMDHLGSFRWFCAWAQEKTQHNLLAEWMFDGPSTMPFFADADHTHYLLAIGTNPRVSKLIRNHNKLLRAMKGDASRKLVVVDPRVSDFAKDADLHVPLRPGTDAYFLLALCAILVREHLVDEAWLAENTRDFDAVTELLAPVDLDEMARRCDVPRAQIERVAREFAAAPSACIEHGLGAEHIWFSTFVSYLAYLAVSLTGNAGQRGGNVFFGTFAPPVRLPDRFEEPPRTVAHGIRGVRALSTYHMFSPTLLPEEILVDHPDRIRALFIDNSNPLLSYSDTARWREALAALDLCVVVDFSLTETAEAHADYVLPAATPYQKWGYADFPKRWPELVFQLRPPVRPIGDEEAVRTEPEIYGALVRAMGIFEETPPELIELGKDVMTPEGAARFFARGQELAAEAGDERPGGRLAHWTYEAVGPHLPSPDLAGVWTFCMLNAMVQPEVLVRSLGSAWREANSFEIGTELFRRILDHPEGVEIGRLDPEEAWASQLGWEDGRIRLLPEALVPEFRRALETDVSAEDPAYPFTVSLGVRTRWTANTLHRDGRWRKGRGPHCTLHLGPEDAARLGIESGTSMRVTSRRASLTLPAEVESGIRPGFAWIPNGFGITEVDADGNTLVQGVNVNELTDSADRDPFTGCPHHKGVRCRIEAAGE